MICNQLTPQELARLSPTKHHVLPLKDYFQLYLNDVSVLIFTSLIWSVVKMKNSDSCSCNIISFLLWTKVVLAAFTKRCSNLAQIFRNKCFSIISFLWLQSKTLQHHYHMSLKKLESDYNWHTYVSILLSEVDLKRKLLHKRCHISKRLNMFFSPVGVRFKVRYLTSELPFYYKV